MKKRRMPTQLKDDKTSEHGKHVLPSVPLGEDLQYPVAKGMKLHERKGIEVNQSMQQADPRAGADDIIRETQSTATTHRYRMRRTIVQYNQQHKNCLQCMPMQASKDARTDIYP